MKINVIAVFNKAKVKITTMMYNVTMGEWPYFLLGRYEVRLSECDLNELFFGNVVTRTVRTGTLAGMTVCVKLAI